MSNKVQCEISNPFHTTTAVDIYLCVFEIKQYNS